MSQYKIAVVVGSLRKDSHNLKLASALAKLAGRRLFVRARRHWRFAAVQPG